MNGSERQISLPHGRRLGIAGYGDPQGRPAFYFHGWPGSRLEARLMDAVAREFRAQVVAVDRPGYGLSDFQPGRTMLDWPNDIVELANALKLDEFAVLGVSGGGPYALACAAKIPDRLSATTIICGLGPMHAANATKGMMRQNRFLLLLARKAHWLARPLLTVFIRVIRRNPQLFMPPRLLTGMSESDKAALRRPEFRQTLFTSTMEAFRQGTRGAAWDGRLYAHPWPFQLQDIAREIFLWHGERDVFVPVLMGRHQAKALPRCDATFFPDEGHLSLPLNRMREILSAMMAET
jgi:pimeloyl-ACP methyl ester carboxylesterase